MSIPAEAGNEAIKNGTLGAAIQSFMAKHKPEAAYFTTQEGHRTAFFVVEMTENLVMPALAEPFFMTFNARVDFTPVMNAQDPGAGLAAMASTSKP